MKRQKRQLNGLAVVSIFLLALCMVGTLWAAPDSKTLPQIKIPPHKTVRPQIKAPVNKQLVPIATELGDIEIVTDLEGRHFWQIAVRNTGTRDARNFRVIVTVEGFRKEDRVQTMGVIDLLQAGHTAYARAEL